jgi:hypothetical protein
MLPSGFHCDRCHALVRVDEAYVGDDPDDFIALFDMPKVIALLVGHTQLTCARAEPLLNVDVSIDSGPRPGDP